MKPVVAAIWAGFAPGDPFHDALGGRMYYDEAPTGTAAPYAVLFPVSTPDFSPWDGTRMHRVRWQLDIYAAGRSAAMCWDLSDLALAFFGQTFRPGDWQAFRFILQNAPAPRRAGDDYWRSTAEFLAWAIKPQS